MPIFASKFYVMKALRSLIATLLIAAGTTVAADNFQYLTVSTQDSETSFELSQISKITFSETNMILTLSNGNTQELPLAQLQKMFFTDNASAISTTGTSKSKVTMNGGTVYIDVADGERVTIYNIGGTEVLSTTFTMSTSALPKGVYIIRMGNETKKILNK